MRYNPDIGTIKSGDYLNDLNAKIRADLQATGKFMISRSNINDDVILRPVTSNPHLKQSNLDDMIAEIVKIGDRITTQ
jgi:hypothetical protein